jgi:hypothetical protein
MELWGNELLIFICPECKQPTTLEIVAKTEYCTPWVVSNTLTLTPGKMLDDADSAHYEGDGSDSRVVGIVEAYCSKCFTQVLREEFPDEEVDVGHVNWEKLAKYLVIYDPEERKFLSTGPLTEEEARKLLVKCSV